MSDYGLKLVGSCRVDLSGAAAAAFISNSGAFETVTAAVSVVQLQPPAAGRQIRPGDVFIVTPEGTAFGQCVVNRAFVAFIQVRNFDALGAVQLQDFSVDWYTVDRG
ncbi:hypothetical protein LCGC14_1022850 [marine sediment metagenome]|uniref:Uncharacterized protein n=1 Tax=marine sediment metagenome TaxID=412755 RepID=A0A0F9QF34_9ZZZZ